MSEKYIFTQEMGEISGFGGTYEETCRKMLKVGLEWWDKHPFAIPKFKGFKNVYGLCLSDNKDAKKLEKAITDKVNNFTGAMFQAVISSIFYIHKNGWEKYKEEMSKKE